MPERLPPERLNGAWLEFYRRFAAADDLPWVVLCRGVAVMRCVESRAKMLAELGGQDTPGGSVTARPVSPAARGAIPRLCDEVDRLRRVVAQLIDGVQHIAELCDQAEEIGMPLNPKELRHHCHGTLTGAGEEWRCHRSLPTSKGRDRCLDRT
jgi:hypothetical protein